MDPGPARGRPRRAGGRGHRHPAGVLRRRRQRCPRGPRRARLVRHGLPADRADPGYGVQPEFDDDFAWHYGYRTPDHRRRQRRRRRHRAGAGAVLRPAVRQRAGQDHDRGTQARPARRVRDELGAPPPRRRHTGRRPAAVGPDRHRRRHRRLGPVERRRSPTAKRRSPPLTTTPGCWPTTVGPNAVTTTKRQLYRDLHRHDAAASVAESKRLLDEAMRTAEYREGIAALRDRRPPHFDGRLATRGGRQRRGVRRHERQRIGRAVAARSIGVWSSWRSPASPRPPPA